MENHWKRSFCINGCSMSAFYCSPPILKIFSLLLLLFFLLFVILWEWEVSLASGRARVPLIWAYDLEFFRSRRFISLFYPRKEPNDGNLDELLDDAINYFLGFDSLKKVSMKRIPHYSWFYFDLRGIFLNFSLCPFTSFIDSVPTYPKTYILLLINLLQQQLFSNQ